MKTDRICRFLALAAVSALGLLSARAGDLLRWGNAGDPILYTNGLAVVESLGWVVGLYEDGGNGTIDAPGAADNDDILRHTTTFGSAGGNGYFYEDWTTPGASSVTPGDSVYTRIFNDITINGASLYATIESALSTVSAYNNDPPNTGGYYSPNDAVTASSWQVVPEPASLALFAAGALAIGWLRRKRLGTPNNSSSLPPCLRGDLLAFILLVSAFTAQAAPPQVVGYDERGNLMFQGAAASNYFSLEFAPTASGPWTNWGAVTEQPITGAVMTAPVPVYYRIRQMDAGSYPQYATGTPVYVESDPYWTQEKSQYATGTPLYGFTESDPQWQADKGKYATGTPIYVEGDPAWKGTSGSVWTAINGKQPAGSYATGTPVYVEVDPVFSRSAASGISSSQVVRWNTSTADIGQSDLTLLEAKVTELQAKGSLPIQPSSNVFAEVFLDRDGYNNSILTTNTTAVFIQSAYVAGTQSLYDAQLYQPGYGEWTWITKKTFTVVNARVICLTNMYQGNVRAKYNYLNGSTSYAQVPIYTDVNFIPGYYNNPSSHLAVSSIEMQTGFDGTRGGSFQNTGVILNNEVVINTSITNVGSGYSYGILTVVGSRQPSDVLTWDLWDSYSNTVSGLPVDFKAPISPASGVITRVQLRMNAADYNAIYKGTSARAVYLKLFRE